jgi:chaperonin GroES
MSGTGSTVGGRSLIPLHDRCIVIRKPKEIMAAEGIYRPEKMQEPPAEGKVIAVGIGKTLADGSVIPMSVVVGDTVLFGRYSGIEIEVELGVEATILREDEILCKEVEGGKVEVDQA